jgi:hypothetical protein
MDINIVVKNQYFKSESDLMPHLFGPEQGEIKLIPQMSMWDVLVDSKLFKSKSDARKNWDKTGGDIPPGFNQFVVGKKKTLLTIWNPTLGTMLCLDSFVHCATYKHPCAPTIIREIL